MDVCVCVLHVVGMGSDRDGLACRAPPAMDLSRCCVEPRNGQRRRALGPSSVARSGPLVGPTAHAVSSDVAEM